MRFLFGILLFLATLGLHAQSQGPFAPAAGIPGTSAIHKDSSLISYWADSVIIQRGYLDIANKSLGFSSHGDSSLALGYADGQVVSLGDSGLATFYLSTPIYNQAGPEFAIFENSFSDVFLEFAFVEVSADGQTFYRFPATCLLDTSVQTGAFGSSEPSYVKNLAGKYRADYGQPFDLAELPQLDTVRYIRIVDAIGSIDPQYASRDAQGRIINEPYPTAFASGGFDLDALAFLNPNSIGINEFKTQAQLPYPNPAKTRVSVEKAESMHLLSLNGTIIKIATGSTLSLDGVPAGLYILQYNFKDGDQKRSKLWLRP